MGENSKIEWTDHTFNPVVGCTKVSAACDHCYAESWAKRTGQSNLWNGDRRRTAKSTWDAVRHWNKRAGERGVREKVFGPSLADPFDNQWEPVWREDYLRLIAACQNLDFLLLTKRPQNIEKMLRAALGKVYDVHWPFKNVWLGTTVENQQEADRRIPALLSVPASIHFLSCEPLLGPIDLWLWLGPSRVNLPPIDWVIVGGESGPKARPMHPDWPRVILGQCDASRTAFLFKQHGEWLSPRDDNGSISYGGNARICIGDPDNDGVWLYRVGKKAAGRLLGGRTYDGFPEALR